MHSASVSFTVVTAQTGSSTTTTISGVYGSTQSAALTITPCNVAMQSAGAPASVALTTGTDNLTLAEVQIWPILAQLAPLSRPSVPQTTSFDFRHAWRPPFAIVRGAGK
ncbi:MAG: hypothetical protein ACRD3J_21320 [Thermoanaerobaculia bacterium]